MLDFTLKATVSSRKTRTAAKKRAGFLPTPQHSYDRARALIFHTQEQHKHSFDRRLLKV